MHEHISNMCRNKALHMPEQLAVYIEAAKMAVPSGPVEFHMQHLDLAPAVLRSFRGCLLLRAPVLALGWWRVDWQFQGLIQRRSRPAQNNG